MKTTRRILLTLCLLASPALAEERPNILLLMAEDLSARVGAFGDPVAMTPNLDALAAQGVRYPNTFTTAGVCAPSRAAHILGMHQVATGTQHMRTSTRPAGGYAAVPPPEARAYPELLRAQGYYTFTDRKTDYQFVDSPMDAGPFTIWDSAGESAPDWRARATGQPFFGFRNFLATHESGIFPPLGSMPHSLTHLMMQFMRWWWDASDAPPVVDPASVVLPPYYPDTPTVREDVARHYNNIAVMDRQVGEILAQLEADDLADSTIVIWTTDHGDGLPRAKRDLYDSGIRVPMIIRWPERFRPEGAVPGSVDERLVSFVDFAPTLLALAGAPVPAYLHGREFLYGEPRRYIYAARDRIDEVEDRQRAVRDGRFKYIRSWHPELAMGHPLAFRDNIPMVREMRALHRAGGLEAAQSKWFEPVGREQLYDLHADPFELNNLAGNPDFAAPQSRLRDALHARLAAIGDWSEISEEAMVARFTKNGEQKITPAPAIEFSDGQLVLVSAVGGASLGFRVDGGHWQLYTGPTRLAPGSRVEARAVRYGWQESEVVSAGGS